MVAGSPVAGDPVAVPIEPLVVGADDGQPGEAVRDQHDEQGEDQSLGDPPAIGAR
jgi:hypothetical protein